MSKSQQTSTLRQKYRDTLISLDNRSGPIAQPSPSLTYQAFETVCGQSQSCGLRGFGFAVRIFFKLDSENVIDVPLGSCQLRFASRCLDLIHQPIEARQSIVVRSVRPFHHEFPCRREHRGNEAEQHRQVEKLVSILVQERLLLAVEECGRSGMDRNIGVLVDAGRADLREKWIFAEQIAPHLHHRLREGGYDGVAESFVRYEIERNAQGRRIFIRDCR